MPRKAKHFRCLCFNAIFFLLLAFKSLQFLSLYLLHFQTLNFSLVYIPFPEGRTGAMNLHRYKPFIRLSVQNLVSLLFLFFWVCFSSRRSSWLRLKFERALLFEVTLVPCISQSFVWLPPVWNVNTKQWWSNIFTSCLGGIFVTYETI